MGEKDYFGAIATGKQLLYTSDGVFLLKHPVIVKYNINICVFPNEQNIWDVIF